MWAKVVWWSLMNSRGRMLSGDKLLRDCGNVQCGRLAVDSRADPLRQLSMSKLCIWPRSYVNHSVARFWPQETWTGGLKSWMKFTVISQTNSKWIWRHTYTVYSVRCVQRNVKTWKITTVGQKIVWITRSASNALIHVQVFNLIMSLPFSCFSLLLIFVLFLSLCAGLFGHYFNLKRSIQVKLKENKTVFIGFNVEELELKLDTAVRHIWITFMDNLLLENHGTGPFPNLKLLLFFHRHFVWCP